jgi:hypothetical protein
MQQLREKLASAEKTAKTEAQLKVHLYSAACFEMIELKVLQSDTYFFWMYRTSFSFV